MGLLALISLGRAGAGQRLTARERDFLSLVSQHGIGKRRKDLQQFVETEQDPSSLEEIRRELLHLCRGIITIAQQQLCLNLDSECVVFFLKLLADHARYIASFADGDVKEDGLSLARASYQQASAEASEHLGALHLFRVAVALNYSVFTHDVLGGCREAIGIAQKALSDAGPAAHQKARLRGSGLAMLLESLPRMLQLGPQS